VTFLHAQEKQKFNPVEFSVGNWAGEIKGEIQGCLPCWYEMEHQCPEDLPWHPFRIELIGNRSMGADTKIQAKYPPLAFHCRGSVGFMAPGVMGIMIAGLDPNFYHDPNYRKALGFVTMLYSGGFKISEASNETIKLIFGAFGKPDDMNATGELYRVELLKKNFPRDIKPNEPIKTDKKTQLEITMPSKKVIKIAQNTEAVIKSESLIEVMRGRIHNLIKKLKPETKFNIRTPTATTGVRGTEYEIEVKDDGTTTVMVFSGEVEFSDIENRKTVIVKENQMSICKPKDLPQDPYEFNQEQILKWWR
jgi:hypothetical protein